MASGMADAKDVEMLALILSSLPLSGLVMGAFAINEMRRSRGFEDAVE